MAAARPTKRGKRRPHAARRSNRGAEFLAPTRGLRRLQGSISGCREKLAATAPRRPSGRGHTAPSPAGLPPLAGLFIVLLGWRRIARRSPFEGASFVSPLTRPVGFRRGFSFRHRNPDGRCRVLRTFMSNPCLAGKLAGFFFRCGKPARAFSPLAPSRDRRGRFVSRSAFQQSAKRQVRSAHRR